MNTSRSYSGLLEEVKAEIRKNPTKAEPRFCYFQLLCMADQYDKANDQLVSIGEVSGGEKLMLDVLSKMVDAERYRDEVFLGNEAPRFFGAPSEWMQLLHDAITLEAGGDDAGAWNLRSEVLQQASAVSGTVNGADFEWITDGDGRLGPVLELFVNGQYGWMAFESIKSLSADAPADLGDMLWFKVKLELVDGRKMEAVVPVCYPFTAQTGDDALMIAGKTDWKTVKDGCYTGMGQRTLFTNNAEISLLELRELCFHSEKG